MYIARFNQDNTINQSLVYRTINFIGTIGQGIQGLQMLICTKLDNNIGATHLVPWQRLNKGSYTKTYLKKNKGEFHA